MVQLPSPSDAFPKKRTRLRVKQVKVIRFDNEDQPVQSEDSYVSGYILVDESGASVHNNLGLFEAFGARVGTSIPSSPEAAWALIEGKDFDLIPPETPLFVHQIVYIDGTSAEKIISESPDFYSNGEESRIVGINGCILRVKESQIRSRTVTRI